MWNDFDDDDYDMNRTDKTKENEQTWRQIFFWEYDWFEEECLFSLWAKDYCRLAQIVWWIFVYDMKMNADKWTNEWFFFVDFCSCFEMSNCLTCFWTKTKIYLTIIEWTDMTEWMKIGMEVRFKLLYFFHSN